MPDNANFPPGTNTADPALIKQLEAIKANPDTSQFVQKLIAFVIGMLTGQPAELKESGDYSKSQGVTILGVAGTLAETLSGSVDVTWTPSV